MLNLQLTTMKGQPIGKKDIAKLFAFCEAFIWRRKLHESDEFKALQEKYRENPSKTTFLKEVRKLSEEKGLR